VEPWLSYSIPISGLDLFMLKFSFCGMDLIINAPLGIPVLFVRRIGNLDL